MFGLGGNKPDFSVAKSVTLTKDPTGQPAVSLQKVEQHGVDLRKKSEAAGISLAKHNLQGIRAQAVMVLDHSGSMYNDYQNGAVQALVERALGFALQIDADGQVPVVPFDHRVLATVGVGLNNYQGIVNSQVWKGRDMGSTDLAEALKVVRDMARVADDPIFCMVVTDGNPDSPKQTTEVVCDLARFPVFIKFLALRSVPYLQELDDLGDDKRLLDNVDSKFFSDLNISDQEFADALAEEWDSWIKLATAKGVLK